MRIIGTAVGLIACAASVGYLHADFDAEYREDFSYSKEAGAVGELVLENINGDITVTGVDGLKAVEVSGVKIIHDRTMEAAKSHSGDVQVDVRQSSSGVTVRTNHPDGVNLAPYTVTYQVRVPNGWKVSVRNVNGDVKVASVHDNVAIDLINGMLETNGTRGNLNVSVVNGKIHSNAALPENGTCKLDLTNGEIDARLMVPPSADCELQAVNGPITLTLPKGSSANVTATASIGRVDIDGLSFSNMKRSANMGPGTSFEGVLGAGNSSINLTVTSGTIELKGY